MSRKLLPTLGLLPKKRTAAEDNDDDDNDDGQTNEDADVLFQKEDNAKRARLASLSDTTLQDLPNELLECILVKVVAMEIKDLKLIKSVWKDKADLVINRLKPVSSHWTSILSTNSFRCKLHRTLDDTAGVTFRLEMLYQSTPRTQPFAFNMVTSLNDDIFTIEQREDENYVTCINVYKRDNMAVAKDFIPLDAAPECMAACNVSKCVYVGLQNGDNTLSVISISKDGDDKFKISPWIMKDPKLSVYKMFVSGNGNLLIRPLQTGKNRNVVRICDANGSLQRDVTLPGNIAGFKQATDCVRTVLQKLNGNLVIVYKSECKTKLLEMDANGSVVRRYKSQIVDGLVNFADIHGRIVIADSDWESGIMELLDSDFNLVGSYDFEKDEDDSPFVCNVNFMSERNEIVRTRFDCISETQVTSIYRFTKE